MPKFRTFEKMYESLNVHHKQETPRIPESERPSNNLQLSDHSLCDFLFEDYKDGKGRLLLKGKFYRLDDEQFRKFTELMKDKGE